MCVLLYNIKLTILNFIFYIIVNFKTWLLHRVTGLIDFILYLNNFNLNYTYIGLKINILINSIDCMSEYDSEDEEEQELYGPNNSSLGSSSGGNAPVPPVQRREVLTEEQKAQIRLEEEANIRLKETTKNNTLTNMVIGLPTNEEISEKTSANTNKKISFKDQSETRFITKDGVIEEKSINVDFSENKKMLMEKIPETLTTIRLSDDDLKYIKTRADDPRLDRDSMFYDPAFKQGLEEYKKSKTNVETSETNVETSVEPPKNVETSVEPPKNYPDPLADFYYYDQNPNTQNKKPKVDPYDDSY